MLGVGIPNGRPNFQNAIARVKTHWLEDFLYHWKAIET
jgi:hypothetical protein